MVVLGFVLGPTYVRLLSPSFNTQRCIRMKFICDKCQTRYSIADERVSERVLRIRCKTCGNVIRVGANPDPAPGGVGASADAEGPKVWHLAINGQSQGPFDARGTARRAVACRSTDEVFVWKAGFASWLPPKEVPDIWTEVLTAKADVGKAIHGADAVPDPDAPAGTAGEFDGIQFPTDAAPGGGERPGGEVEATRIQQMSPAFFKQIEAELAADAQRAEDERDEAVSADGAVAAAVDGGFPKASKDKAADEQLKADAVEASAVSADNTTSAQAPGAAGSPQGAPETPSTTAPEAKAPETKAPETKAPEAKAPEAKASEAGASDDAAPPRTTSASDIDAELAALGAGAGAPATTTGTDQPATSSASGPSASLASVAVAAGQGTLNAQSAGPASGNRRLWLAFLMVPVLLGGLAVGFLMSGGDAGGPDGAVEDVDLEPTSAEAPKAAGTKRPEGPGMGLGPDGQTPGDARLGQKDTGLDGFAQGETRGGTADDPFSAAAIAAIGPGQGAKVGPGVWTPRLMVVRNAENGRESSDDATATSDG